MKRGPVADVLLLAHMRECIMRIDEYTGGDRERFELPLLAAALERMAAHADAPP